MPAIAGHVKADLRASVHVNISGLEGQFAARDSHLLFDTRADSSDATLPGYGSLEQGADLAQPRQETPLNSPREFARIEQLLVDSLFPFLLPSELVCCFRFAEVGRGGLSNPAPFLWAGHDHSAVLTQEHRPGDHIAL